MREQCACSFDKIGLTGEFVLGKLFLEVYGGDVFPPMGQYL